MTRTIPFLLATLLLIPLVPADLSASPVILRPVEEPPEEKALRRSTRELPGLVESWRCNCNPQAVAVENGVVYVMGHRRLFALNAADGAVLWDGGPEAEPAPHEGRPIVTEDRVAAVFGTEVVLRDRASGLEIARLDLESRIDDVAGPPLVVTRRLPETSGTEELVRIDTASGQVLARTRLGDFPDLFVRGSSLYVSRLDDHRQVFSRLDADTLAIVEEWDTRGGFPLPPDAGLVWFLQNRMEGLSLHALDLTSGEWTSSEMESGAQRVHATSKLGFAEIAAEWNGQPRGLVRYEPGTGAVLWSAPLPCRPGPPTESGGRLVVPCGWEAGGAGLLLFLDPDTGEPLETLETPSRVSSMHSAADAWILVTDDAVVAVNPTRRALPRAKTEPVDEAVDRILKGIRHTSPLVRPGDVESLLALGSAAWPMMMDRLPESDLAAATTLAQALGEAGYRPAAPAVAHLLDGLPEDRSSWRKEAVAHPPERLLLKVLADLGGSEQAPSVGRILLDSRQPWLVRQEAAFALAAIADPPALSWLDRFATLRRMAKKISEGDDEPPSLGAAADQRDTTADLEAASIRDAIRRHLEWFGSGEGPTAVCSLGSSWPETLDQAREDECLSIRIEEVDAVEGAREIADRLPLEEEDRRYVVTFEPGWRAAKSLYRVRPIGDRWLVRSVWHWVS